MANPVFDVCVSGTGIIGRALALALSCKGWKVALVGDAYDARMQVASKADVRTYALNAQSIELFKRLRVWDGIAKHATALQEMRIAGDTSGRLVFSAWQQCVSDLGYIVDAQSLENSLADALTYAPHVFKLDQVPTDVPLLAICEGQQSKRHKQLGVVIDKHNYDHWGVAARLTHNMPHQGIARQWFFGQDTSPDVLALLPFDHPISGSSYGLVWSTHQDNAKRLKAMSVADFENALHQRLGKEADQTWHGLKLVSDIAAWPLAQSVSRPWVGPGWALLGDAAHVVHPLAGQGLNLGLADVIAFVDVLSSARDHQPWRSVGDINTLKRYERARWFDTHAMLSLTDGLVHLFGSSHPVAYIMRNQAMSAVNQLAVLKRCLVNQARGQSMFSSSTKSI